MSDFSQVYVMPRLYVTVNSLHALLTQKQIPKDPAEITQKSNTPNAFLSIQNDQYQIICKT